MANSRIIYKDYLLDVDSKKFIHKVKCVMALVENEDGTMRECTFKDIRFTDREKKK